MTNQSSFSTISRAASSSFVMEIPVPPGAVAAKEWGSCRERGWLGEHRGPGTPLGWESTGDLGHLWVCHLLLRAWGPSGGACPPCADPKARLGRVRVDSNVDSTAL